MYLRGLDLHTVLPAHIVACAFTVFGEVHDSFCADFQPLHLFQHASGVFLRQTVDLVGNALKERLRHSPDAFIRDAVQFVPCDFYIPKLLRRSLFVGPHGPVGLAAAKPGHLQRCGSMTMAASPCSHFMLWFTLPGPLTASRQRMPKAR